MRFRFSRRAEADLEMIASYIGRNDHRVPYSMCEKYASIAAASPLSPELIGFVPNLAKAFG